MSSAPLTEYDAFQLLEQSLQRAAEACDVLASHRPDQPWPLISALMAEMREKTFQVATASAAKSAGLVQ